MLAAAHRGWSDLSGWDDSRIAMGVVRLRAARIAKALASEDLVSVRSGRLPGRRGCCSPSKGRSRQNAAPRRLDSAATAGVDASIRRRATVSVFAEDRLEAARASATPTAARHHHRHRGVLRRTEGRVCRSQARDGGVPASTSLATRSSRRGRTRAARRARAACAGRWL